MTRGLQHFAAWLASTAVAVALSWLGIRFVLDAGAPQRPLVVAGPTQSSAITTTTAALTTAAPTTTTTVAVIATVAATTTTTLPPTTTTTTPPLPSENGTWTERDGEPVYLRSFSLQGGVAAISFSAKDLEPISATPRQGFAATVEQPAAAVVVEFTSPGHRSRLEATWVGGPQWRIVETG